MFSQVERSASNLDKRYRSMEGSQQYGRYREELAERRMQMADIRMQAKDAKARLGEYADYQTGDELYDEYLSQLIELAYDKIMEYTSLLDESVDCQSMTSKLIYLLIKNPILLEEIFHGNRTEFALHEENGEFWYLPESILIRASDLMIEKVED